MQGRNYTIIDYLGTTKNKFILQIGDGMSVKTRALLISVVRGKISSPYDKYFVFAKTAKDIISS